MSWNYRLMLTRHALPDGAVEERYAVHEVYYDEQGRPNGFTSNPSWPQGDTWLEFQNDYSNYQKAALVQRSKVLDERDVLGYVDSVQAQKVGQP